MGDPTCTGRPTKDTFAVSWPEVDGKIWWKDDLKKFEPEKFMSLLGRVVEHLNKKEATLFVKDVYCGMDPSLASTQRTPTSSRTCSLVLCRGLRMRTGSAGSP